MQKNQGNVKDVSGLEDYFENAEGIGFQATNLGRARAILSGIKAEKEKGKTTVYLGFTANMVASGARGMIAALVESGLADVVVTTAGAIEHDIIKAHEPYLIGDFDVDDAQLHKKEINRIGNVFVPTQRYVLFERIFNRVTPSCVQKHGDMISPSEFARECGEYIGANKKDKHSFLMHCTQKDVPVFCPGITDGAIGLQTYFYKQKNRKFGIDVTKDMKALADITLNADSTSAIILGGGISKHHIIGVNILRGGLDRAVYLTTAAEWDGSLSGAKTREAISWGKIREKSSHAHVYGDVTINLPMLMHGIIKTEGRGRA
ncbi:MAG: deoxyhypusine synthase [Candidatus Micrarchaeia archaeon]